MPPKAAWLFAFLPLSGVLAPRAAAEQIHDPDLGFSITIPDGFQPDPGLVALNPSFAHAFRRIDPAGGVDTVIIIERLRATIGREPLDGSHMPPDFKGRLFRVPWQGFEIDALEVPQNVDGLEAVNFNAQVPLKRRAIQIRVIGSRDQKEQLRALLGELLASTRGESNWLGSVAPPTLAASPRYGWLLVGLTILGLGLGLAALWLLRRRSARGVVLVVAVCIYALSWALPPGQMREMRSAIGGLRLLGILGMVLGLLDAVRRRPPPHAVGQPPAPADAVGCS